MVNTVQNSIPTKLVLIYLNVTLYANFLSTTRFEKKNPGGIHAL
jgi:hypothetical protein